MKKSFLLALVLLACRPVYADRISQMTRTELCTYTAQLKVAAYHFFEQGKPREEVIKWHGDETQNEMDFVNKTVDEAYVWLASWKESSIEMLPVQSFGDMVYQACMGQKDS
jgi:hypothetical protein